MNNQVVPKRTTHVTKRSEMETVNKNIKFFGQLKQHIYLFYTLTFSLHVSANVGLYLPAVLARSPVCVPVWGFLSPQIDI